MRTLPPPAPFCPVTQPSISMDETGQRGFWLGTIIYLQRQRAGGETFMQGSAGVVCLVTEQAWDDALAHV